MIELGRGLCSDYRISAEKEWLVTNGIGGFASGTVAGGLSRRYHGLLVAALEPPLGRTLLVTKFDESVTYAEQDYLLHTNSWSANSVYHKGFIYLDRFHLEGTTPVWTYTFADAVLEKRVWMQRGASTTYIRYDFKRGRTPLDINVKAIINDRDYHSKTSVGDWSTQFEQLPNGLKVTAQDGSTPVYLLADQAPIKVQKAWYRNYYLKVEAYRGLPATEDHLFVGTFSTQLQPNQSLTIIASTDPEPNLDSTTAYAERRAYEQTLLKTAKRKHKRKLLKPLPATDDFHLAKAIEQLILAADQFIVQRAHPDNPDGKTIIAGYHWFSDWGRDTMISLPGLTLATGRPAVARQILHTYAQFVDQGMIPNRFPDSAAEPEYNTVDATLWFFEAIRAYHEATNDKAFIEELFPILQSIISNHQSGTRYNIHQDRYDGLIYAGQDGVQLTWMDAKVDNWVVTPRIGKPIEINALWYNALCSMADFSELLGKPRQTYDDLIQRVKRGFARFWNEELNYCYDVIGGPDGLDDALRPNQLFAVALPHSPLSKEQQRAVLDACTRNLLTPHGMRSLAPTDPEYIGIYGGDRYTRDAAYHQGTTWGWLIGPYVAAHLRVYEDPVTARSFLYPLLRHLYEHGLGSLSEVFDGDPPFTPRGCIAQAWTVAEVLRMWQKTSE